MPFWNMLQSPDVDFSTGSKNSKEYRAQTAAALEDGTRSDFGSPGDFLVLLSAANWAAVANARLAAGDSS